MRQVVKKASTVLGHGLIWKNGWKNELRSSRFSVAFALTGWRLVGPTLGSLVLCDYTLVSCFAMKHGSIQKWTYFAVAGFARCLPLRLAPRDPRYSPFSFRYSMG